MKKSIKTGYLRIYHIFVLGIFFVITINPSHGQTHWAFLVGISNYSEGTYWSTINAHNDIELLKSVLSNRSYKQNNIIVLEDKEATKANIIAQLNKLLEQQIVSGDQLFMHFSSHGQQRIDKNGDELDGLDECIVPYDSPMFYQENKYEGERLLSDDELNLYLGKARKKLGKNGHIFVSVDACHSGTSLRGYGSNARGTDVIMGAAITIPKEVNNNDQSFKETEYTLSKNQNELAEICVFYGSSANQLNYEYVDKSGISYGSLSYFLAKNLTQIEKECSYRSLFKQISYEMALAVPRQQAEAEGNLNLSVLQGKDFHDNSKYRISELLSDSTAMVQGGIFHDILEGSIVNIVEECSSSIITKSQAKVISSHANYSIIQFSSQVSLFKDHEYFITVKEKNVLPGYCSYSIIGDDNTMINQLTDFMQSLLFLQSNPRNPSLIYSIKSVNPNSYKCFVLNHQFQNIDSVIIFKENQLIKPFEKLRKITKNYLKAKYLKELDLKDPSIDVSFTIIPKRFSNPSQPKKNKRKSTSGELIETLRVGQSFSIKLHNNGVKTAYVCMINIQSDNKVNVLFPYSDMTPYDFKIESCKDLLIPVQYIAKNPKGIETLRLIASNKPIDFRTGFSTRSGSQAHPISMLVDESLFDQIMLTRGENKTINMDDEININTLQFKIID
ncbi:MAG: caspase family protein [Saprospiraceae bacterium]|nr:caspase family protein [Candidatus Vicinibacter affinis]